MRGDPRLWKRYNGVYYVILSGDRRTSLKTSDPDEAKKLFHKFCRERISGKLAVLQGAKSVRLGKFREEYLKGRESRADSTQRNDRIALAHLEAYLGATRTLRSITTREIEQFKAGLLKGIKPITANGYLRHLHAAFATAVRWEYIHKNPVDGVPLELEPERESPPVIEGILEAIMEKATEVERRAFLIALYSGLRPFELCRLQGDHIVGGTIRVRGKRGKLRVVPLLEECAALIGDVKPKEYVIPWRHPDTLSHKFRAVATAAGYSNVRLYDLRHTFGTVMIQAGMDPFHLKSLMGHTDIKTTQRYVTVTQRHLEAVMGKAKGVFSGKGKPDSSMTEAGNYLIFRDCAVPS